MSKDENMSEIVKMLDNNVNLDMPIKNGVTRLMASVYLDDIKAVKLLLRNGANINARDSFGQNALMISILAKNREMAKYLIAKKANINNIDNEGKTALMFASSMGDHEIVELLAERGVNIRHRSHDLDYDAFVYAALNNHTNILHILNNFYPYDKNGDTDLMILIDQENSEHPTTSTIKFIIEKKFININKQNKSGETALMLASFMGKDDIVNSLIDHGANKELEDNSGRTALFHAVLGKNLNTLKLLAEKGANVNVSGNFGETLIDIAEDVGVGQYLLENV